ncbi:hypothetical protein COK19_21345 [Bacillus cereus]|nr:hypothetical protein COK19_21345 [Bacillus cereus]
MSPLLYRFRFFSIYSIWIVTRSKAPVVRRIGHFALSVEAKSASQSRAPMPCDSERAASAFLL